MTSKITITVASLSDREALVAELWIGDLQLGEVSQEVSGEFRVELYAQRGAAGFWPLELDELLSALNKARDSLRGNPSQPPK